MIEQTNLDKRPRVPYSIGTGIPKHGDAEYDYSSIQLPLCYDDC